MLIAMLITSMLVGISTKIFLSFYGDYESSKERYLFEVSLLNTLGRVQKLLQNAIFNSILENGASVEFLEKSNEFVEVWGYSLPCFSSLVSKVEIDEDNGYLKLDMLPLYQGYQSQLDTLCSLYSRPFEVLFVGIYKDPRELYSNAFRARLISYNGREIHTEIPYFLKDNRMQEFSPRIYLIDPHRGYKKIFLKNGGLFLFSGDRIELLDDSVQSMRLEKIEFGFRLEICKEFVCKSRIILEDSF